MIDFGRFVPQTEQCMSESNGIDEWTQPSPPISSSTTNEIPSLLSTQTTPPPIIPTSIPQKPTISSSIIKDE